MFDTRLSVRLLAAGILCAAATCAVAEENPAILAVNRSVSLSYFHSSMYYIEPDSGQSNTGYFDYEKGTLKGGQAAFSYMGPRGIYLNAALNRAAGTLDYRASTPSLEAHSSAEIHELELKIGKGFSPQDASWMFTPYLSGGRRHWRRDIAINTPGELVETYDFDYFGVGQMIQYSPWTRLVFTADGMIARTAHATINVPPVLDHTALGSAPLVKLSLEVDYQAAAMLHLFAGLEYEYFTFGQSDIQTSGFLEPNSETRLRNFDVGLRLSF